MIKHHLLALLLAIGLFAVCLPAVHPQPTNQVSVVHMTKWGIPLAPCAWCGAINGIEVHHIYPQHLWPERARDTNNMVCLCRRCHLVLGHRGCFTNAVTNLIQMIEEGKK